MWLWKRCILSIRGNIRSKFGPVVDVNATQYSDVMWWKLCAQTSTAYARGLVIITKSPALYPWKTCHWFVNLQQPHHNVTRALLDNYLDCNIMVAFVECVLLYHHNSTWTLPSKNHRKFAWQDQRTCDSFSILSTIVSWLFHTVKPWAHKNQSLTLLPVYNNNKLKWIKCVTAIACVIIGSRPPHQTERPYSWTLRPRRPHTRCLPHTSTKNSSGCKKPLHFNRNNCNSYWVASSPDVCMPSPKEVMLCFGNFLHN